MARPSTQTRRRRDILEAAEKVLNRSDIATLRIRDIAVELGLTPNAIRYYYTDVDDLLKDLCRRSDERFYVRRLAALEGIDDAREQLAVTIQAGLPSSKDDSEWRLIWRAVHAAGFEFDTRPDVSEIYHRQVSLYESILEAGAAKGVLTLTSGAHEIAQTIMALEDYLGYRIVARDPLLSRPIALRLIRDYAELATAATLPQTA